MMVGLLLFALQAIAYPPAVLADVRNGTVVLNSSGDGTWDFTAGGSQLPFGGLPDVTHLVKNTDKTNSVICNYYDITTSGVSVHCNKTNLLGLLGNLLGGSTSGLTVNFVARYKAP